MRVPTRLFLICSVFLLASLTLFFTTIHVTAQDFLSAKIISPSELPVWAGILVSGDLNGDGIPDVVYSVPQTTTSGYYSSIGVAFGSTRGLHPAGVYSQAPYTVVIADVNGDGKPDIVGGVNVAATADLLIYLNQGDGTFAAPLISQITTNNSLWPRVMGIGVGDFDGDGKADVVVSDQNGNFFGLHGSGSGTFTLTSQFQQHLISSYRIAQVADLNHDGKLDLVVALVEGATVGVMLGNGNGTFQPLTLLPVYTYWPVVADFNGDGIPDIATTTLILNNGAITSYAAVIYAGNGDGTFRQLNTFPFSSAYGTLLAARDVNGDGELDLIFDGANGFTVCLGQGGGNFGAPVTYSVPRWMNGGAAVGDFNGDGYTDIVGAENYSDPMVYSLRCFPGGTFEGATSLDVPSQPNIIATADLNGDHVPDIAVSEESGTTVLLSNGDGTFRSISDSLILGDQIFLADLDGDTIPDELFVPSSPYSNVSYRHGNGDGTFATPVTGIALYHGASAVSLGDLNLDGEPDLVGIHDGSLAVWLGSGAGAFGTEVDYSANGPYTGSKTMIADINKDGVTDVLANVSGNVAILLGSGDGAGTLNPSTELYPGLDFVLADVNGNQDLIAISADPTKVGFNIYPGDGTGAFGAPTFIPTSQTYTSISAADLNVDGNTDLIFVGSTEVAVMYGDGKGNFGPEKVFLASGISHNVIVGDWNHDGVPDLAVASAFGGSPSPQSITLFLNRSGYRASLSFSENPAEYGQPLSAIFSVKPTVAGSETPSGNVLMLLDGTRSFQGTISSSLYSVDLGTLPVGSHAMDGTYSGDGNYRGKSLSSVPLTVTKADTSIALSASAATVVYGSNLTITINVRPAFSGSPTGNVSLWDGNTLAHSVILDANGTATVSLSSLSVGDHTLTARYDGDTNFLGSTSSVVNEQVRYPTTVTINSNGSTTLLGAPVVFTTNVQSPSGTPTGSVAFYDGTRLLGQVALANGATTFSASSLADGTHAVMASYLGDSTFIASNSSVMTETVSDFSISADNTAISVNAGASASSNLTVSALYGFTGSVAFSCTGAPALATCSVSPASVQVAGASQTVTLTITTTGVAHTAMLHDSHPRLAERFRLALATGTFVFVGLVVGWGGKRRGPFLLLITAIVLCGLSACGGGGGGSTSPNTQAAPATPAGVTTLQVTASTTANGVTVDHQISLTLTVNN